MRRRVAVIAALMSLLWTLVPVGSAMAADPVSGAGSIWASDAAERWIAEFRQQSGAQQVSYAGVDDFGGRTQFRTGQASFAVSELEYDAIDIADPAPVDRDFTYLPVLGNGLALTHSLRNADGTRMTDLRLSGDTAAKIFTGVITSWNDPAIQADNPGRTLPAQAITPIVRRDVDGTSMVLTRWLADRHPALWADFCARTSMPTCAPTAHYPQLPGMAAMYGSTGVVGHVVGAPGAIAYVEYPYLASGGLPAVHLRNEAGAYVAPTPGAVTTALSTVVIRPDQTQDLAPVFANPDPDAYPLSSYAYAIVPTDTRLNFTPAKGETLAAFLRHAVGPGQSTVDALGYAPLPPNLVSAALAQIDLIPGAV